MNPPVEYQAELRQEQSRASEKLRAVGLEQRRVLVVGGAGYVGLPLTQALLNAGYRVRCLDLLLYENDVCVLPHFSNPEYEFMHADLLDGPRLDTALEGVSDVVLLAGLVGDPITAKYPAEAERINHNGYVALIDRLNGRGLNKVIFASTCSNYGLISDGAAAAETQVLNPLSSYARAKVAIERCFLALEGETDYDATILRCATAFGLAPRMRFDLTVNEFTREMFLNRELVVFDAQTWRPYCHVQDLAGLMLNVLDAPVARVSFEIFNAGGDANNFTKQMIVEELQTFFPSAPVAYLSGDRDPRDYRVDFSKVRNTLFFEPKMTIRNGMEEEIAALRQGLFEHVDARPNFYGNREIDYRV